jgi:O-antigen ligase
VLQKITHLGICLIVLSLPLYLVRFRIDWVPVTLLEMMVYGLFGFWVVNVMANVTKGDAKPKIFFSSRHSIFYPIFLIFLGATISTLFSVDIRISAGIWKGWFVVPLLFLIVMVSSLKAKEQIRNILLALTLSGVGVAGIALFYWFNHDLTYDGRLRAFYLSPNHLAMYLSPILILSFYLYVCFKRNFLKISLFIIHCSLFAVIYLTYSYGAWFGLIAALVFLLIGLYYHSRVFSWLISQRMIFYLSSFIILLIILSFLWQMSSQKFQGFLDFSYPSLSSRLVIWQSAWQIIKDHPLIGIGPGMFQKYYLDYQPKFKPYPEWAVPQPHNLFLAFWLQTGLLGLVGLIWLLVVFFSKSIQCFKIPHPQFQVLASVLAAAMIYVLIHGLVDTPYWKNDLSIIFWLIIGLSYTINRLSD